MDFEDIDLDLIKFGALKNYEKHFFTKTLYQCTKRQPVKILSPPLFAESFITDHESGQKYIDLRVDVDDISEDFYDFLLDIDDVCIETIIDNSKEWFGKSISDKKVKNVYQSIFLENGKDIIRVWFPHDKDVPIYTDDKHKVKDIIRDSKLKILMTLKGMWINNKASGCLWEIDAALYCYDLKDYLKDCEPKHPSPNWYDNPSLSEEEEEPVFSLPKSKLITRRKHSTDVVKKHINKELDKEEKKNSKIEKKKLKKMLKKEMKKNSKKNKKRETESSSSVTEIPLDPSPEVFDYIPSNKTPVMEDNKSSVKSPLINAEETIIDTPINVEVDTPINVEVDTPINAENSPADTYPENDFIPNEDPEVDHYSMPFFNSLFNNFQDDPNVEVIHITEEMSNKIEILPDDYEENIKDNSYEISEDDNSQSKGVECNSVECSSVECISVECSSVEEEINQEEQKDNIEDSNDKDDSNQEVNDSLENVENKDIEELSNEDEYESVVNGDDSIEHLDDGDDSVNTVEDLVNEDEDDSVNTVEDLINGDDSVEDLVNEDLVNEDLVNEDLVHEDLVHEDGEEINNSINTVEDLIDKDDSAENENGDNPVNEEDIENEDSEDIENKNRNKDESVDSSKEE